METITGEITAEGERTRNCPGDTFLIKIYRSVISRFNCSRLVEQIDDNFENPVQQSFFCVSESQNQGFVYFLCFIQLEMEFLGVLDCRTNKLFEYVVWKLGSIFPPLFYDILY